MTGRLIVVPADWWVESDGSELAVWRPGPTEGTPEPLMYRFECPAVFDALVRSLPCRVTS